MRLRALLLLLVVLGLLVVVALWARGDGPPGSSETAAEAPVAAEPTERVERPDRVPRARASSQPAPSAPASEPDATAHEPLFTLEPTALPDGPLLWVLRGDARAPELWWLDPADDRTFRRLGTGPRGALLRERTSDGRLLASGFEVGEATAARWVLLDPAAGTERPIEPVGEPNQIWATDLGVVTSGPDGALLHPLDDSAPRPLIGGDQAQVLGRFPGGFLYRTFRDTGDRRADDAAMRVLRADAEGLAQEVLAPGVWQRALLGGGELTLSPDGSRLALTWSWAFRHRPGESFPPGEGIPRIEIRDARSGEVERVFEGFDVAVSAVSSQTPQVELRWMDDRRLRYTETDLRGELMPGPDARMLWVEVDVETGERLAVHEAGPVELQVPTPPADPHFRERRAGPFRIGIRGDVYVGDDAAPSVVAAEISASPWRSRRALWFSPDRAHVFVQLEPPEGTTDPTVRHALLTAATRLRTEHTLPDLLEVHWTAGR